MYASSKQQTGLTDIALQNLDLALFIDGLSYYLHRQCWTGYTVVSQGQEIKAEPLLMRLNTQEAELVALPCEAHLGKGKQINIWTDSLYIFRVWHATSMLWKESGTFTSSGKRVANGEEAEP